jgi:hypothetical protein
MFRRNRATERGRSAASRRIWKRRHAAYSVAGWLLLALVLFPNCARCGAPFETDDPGTVAPGHVELLVFYQSALDAAGRTGASPGLELHFGVFEGFEVDVATPLAFSTAAGASTQRGYGDTTLGLKWRLIEESKDFPLVSLVPKLTFPTGNSDKGLGNGGTQAFLALAAQKSVGRLQTYGNAGYWINGGTDNRNYWFVGGQAQYPFSSHWIIGAEVFYTTAQTQGRSASSGFNIGGYYVFDPHRQLLFSAGRGLQNAAEDDRASVYVGFQSSF